MIWVSVVSWLAVRQQALPPPFAYLGFAAAAALLSGVVGYGLILRPFVVMTVGVGGFLLVPARFFWAGLLLWRSAA